MSRWPTKPLLDVANLTRGTEPGSSAYTDSARGVRFLRVGDISGKTDRPIYANATKFVMVRENDLLLVLDGNPGVVSMGHSGAISSGIRKVEIIDKKNLTTGWLRYALSSPEVQATIKQHTRGITILHASSALSHIHIPVPPMPAQERMVKLLDEANELRKLRTQADQRAGVLISALFYDMFGDPATNRLKQPVNQLDRICKVVGGGTPSKKVPSYWNGKIPWVSPKDMSGEEVHDSEDHICDKAIKESATNLIPAGAVLMVTRSGILKHTLPIAINSVAVTINQDIKAFIPNADCDAVFLASHLRMLAPTILNMVRVGATVQNLETEALKQLAVLCPPLSMQREFASRVREIRRIQTDQAASHNRLNDLFQSMLHRAFQGEL